MVVNGWYNASYVISCPTHVDMIGYPIMAGKAVLICRQNSHPFLDRTLILEQPVKIGRSVARARAAQNNGIFDCKVLSRNHALFWYTNGKFYLQDTKSSNGTFVNNQRLSKSGEESSPREVCSGDVVQFGVDVLESTQKVTHGCIVADLKLYLPDGKEAKASPSTTEVGGIGSVSTEDLYQLNQCIQEALQREQMLQTKLASLQQMVLSLRSASDVGWRALIAEDRILSRVEILENILQSYSKNFPEDKLRDELRKLHDDKSVYQSTAKERLKKIYEEKLEAIQKCQEVERALLNAEAERANFKLLMDRSTEELQELALKYSNQVLKTEEMQNKLVKSEEQNKDMLTRIETNNETQLQRRLENESLLEERIQELESANELAQRQILSLQFQNQTLRDQTNQTGLNNHLSNNVPSPKERAGDIYSERIEPKAEEPRDISTMIDVLFLRLADSFDEQRKAKEVSDLIAARIDLLQTEKLAVLQRINSLGTDLECHSNEQTHYRAAIEDLEERLHACEQRLEAELKTTSTEITSVPDSLHVNGDDRTISRNGGNSILHSLKTENLNTQIRDLKELLAESRTKNEQTETKAKHLQMELDMAEEALNKITESLILQEEKLKEAKKNSEEQEDIVKQLSEHMKCLQTFFKMRFHGKLDLEHEATNKHLEELQALRKQLVEAQQAAKQNKNEAEQLKERVRCLVLALETVESSESNSSQDNKTVEELAAARLECNALKANIMFLEAQIKELKSESVHSQTSEEESRTEVTPNAETRHEVNSQQSVEALETKVSELGEELVLVKEHYVTCSEEKTRLERELEALRQDYQAVTHQPYFNIVFILPLVVLFIAIIIAFYPTLSFIFGTTDTTSPPP